MLACGSSSVYCPALSVAPVEATSGYYTTPQDGDVTLRTGQELCPKGTLAAMQPQLIGACPPACLPCLACQINGRVYDPVCYKCERVNAQATTVWTEAFLSALPGSSVLALDWLRPNALEIAKWVRRSAFRACLFVIALSYPVAFVPNIRLKWDIGARSLLPCRFHFCDGKAMPHRNLRRG